MTWRLSWALPILLWPTLVFAEERATGELPASEPVAEEGSDDALPEAAARRYFLVQPVGQWPSPWAALSAVIDGGATLDGALGWTGIRATVPVYHRYGAVDFGLEARFNGEEFIALDPELVLRAMPFRLAEGRGPIGFSFTLQPGMIGPDPTMTLGGGILGGYLGRIWFFRAYVGVQGDVIQGRAVEIVGHIAAGLRLRYGFRPQLEVDVVGEAQRRGEVTLAIRPALRYWPAEWIGIGLSGDIWVLGPEIITSGLRLDLVFHAME